MKKLKTLYLLLIIILNLNIFRLLFYTLFSSLCILRLNLNIIFDG